MEIREKAHFSSVTMRPRTMSSGLIPFFKAQSISEIQKNHLYNIRVAPIYNAL